MKKNRKFSRSENIECFSLHTKNTLIKYQKQLMKKYLQMNYYDISEHQSRKDFLKKIFQKKAHHDNKLISK